MVSITTVFELSWESPSSVSGENTYPQAAADLGMEETMAEILVQHCLCWLEHLACMESHQMPKQLQKKRPTSHGTERRWRDVAAADIKTIKCNHIAVDLVPGLVLGWVGLSWLGWKGGGGGSFTKCCR